MSWKSPGLAAIQGHSVAAICTAEGEHPNKIIALCRCCPLLNSFIVSGTCTRSRLLSELSHQDRACGLSCLQGYSHHQDRFVPPLNYSLLGCIPIALNFFPALGACQHSFGSGMLYSGQPKAQCRHKEVQGSEMAGYRSTTAVLHKADTVLGALEPSIKSPCFGVCLLVLQVAKEHFFVSFFFFSRTFLQSELGWF